MTLMNAGEKLLYYLQLNFSYLCAPVLSLFNRLLKNKTGPQIVPCGIVQVICADDDDLSVG